ncbi:MAG TPA: (2Fe-2S)-binding protein [Planctomycetaceae bacterium]|nr:(2Fe-2S)-binding protein [Planctomycetaceae bacterium]
MPQITFANRTIACTKGENLRTVLMREGLPLYNGAAKQIHCRGIGTCGTCAVELAASAANSNEQELVSSPTLVERVRLVVPPHVGSSGLRLACQCRVFGDITVTKHAGLWGHRK